MNFHVLTLFPEMIEQGMHTSIIGRAIAGGYLSIDAINIRDYAFNKHQKVDDYPYGGGAGMLMQAEPVYLAYESVQKKLGYRPRVVYLTPQGEVFHQTMAKELAKEKDLVFLCGHYEGIDERVLDEIVTDYVSIGDYVLTGGELQEICGPLHTGRNPEKLNLLPEIFWNILSTAARKNGMDRKFHQFFSPDITQILKHGDGNSPFCVQQSVARIF